MIFGRKRLNRIHEKPPRYTLYRGGLLLSALEFQKIAFFVKICYNH